MSPEEANRHENLRSVYEQYYLHARHVENERLLFTNIFAAIVAGILAYMSQAGLTWYACSFLILLSVLGLLMSHALRISFIKYSRMAEIVVRREWKLQDYSVFYAKKKAESPYPSGEERAKLIDLSQIFHVFYILVCSLSIVLLIRAFGSERLVWSILTAVISVVMLSLFYRRRLYKFENEAYRKMGEIDRKDDAEI